MTKPVSFSLKLSPHERWGRIAAIAEVARLADEIGGVDFQMPDHIIMPVEPGVRAPNPVLYDNFVLAAHLATLTRRMRFIFYVIVAPYRPPIQTAKLLATLDEVAGGRITCGFGVGWLRPEFEALGVPYGERGAITDEYLQAIKALWTEPSPRFQGTYVRFQDVLFEPKPVQKPHPPIWIGGSGPHAVRRVVELGDGWVPMTGTFVELSGGVARVKEAVRAAGRDPEALDFASHLAIGEPDAYRPHHTSDAAHARTDLDPPVPHAPEALLEAIARYRAAGFNHLSLRFNWQTPADLTRELAWLAERVFPQVPDLRDGPEAALSDSRER
jgi:probable F420-dependent oxidoreductase